MIIKISDVYIRDNGNKNIISIKDHPYYLSLKYNNKEIYNMYIKRHYVQSIKITGNWSGFIDLYKSIKKYGFNKNKESIVITNINQTATISVYKNKKNISTSINTICINKFICLHGRHRICILRYIYGHHLKLVINDKGRLQKIII